MDYLEEEENIILMIITEPTSGECIDHVKLGEEEDVEERGRRNYPDSGFSSFILSINAAQASGGIAFSSSL